MADDDSSRTTRPARSLRRRLANAVIVLLAISAAVAIVARVSVRKVPAPDYVMIVVDKSAKTYLSLMYIKQGRDQRDVVVRCPDYYNMYNDFKPGPVESGGWEFVETPGIIYIDYRHNLYYGVPPKGYAIIISEWAEPSFTEPPIRIAEAKALGYQPDPLHEAEGEFEEYVGRFNWAARLFGLRESRWSERGGWRW